jgi:hypothetical protein
VGSPVENPADKGPPLDSLDHRVLLGGAPVLDPISTAPTPARLSAMPAPRTVGAGPRWVHDLIRTAVAILAGIGYLEPDGVEIGRPATLVEIGDG